MTDIKVYNMSGSQVGTMELNDSVFGVEYKESLIHQAVVTLSLIHISTVQKSKKAPHRLCCASKTDINLKTPLFWFARLP